MDYKNIFTLVLLAIITITVNKLWAQTNSMYIYQNGKVVNKVDIKTIDSCTFYNIESIKESNPVIDIEGNTYQTTIINDQIWMAENLKTRLFNDSTPISNISSGWDWSNMEEPAYCWYDNDSALYHEKYGILYNWFTVNTHKICPVGWHVPTDTEWIILERYLMRHYYNYDSSLWDNKYAKSLADTTGWKHVTIVGSIGNSDYPDFQNKTGFSGLPSGYRKETGAFKSIGETNGFWSSTYASYDDALCRQLCWEDYDVWTGTHDVEIGYSIRCLKD